MNGTDQLELSERTAREILNKLEKEYGGLHSLRAAYRLMRCAEELLEFCEHRDSRNWHWETLGDVVARVANKIGPNK